MTAKQELDSFIDRYTPEIAKMARAALSRMRRKIPAAKLLVYDNYNALGIGFSPTEKASDVILSIALYPKWVSLFFLQGAALPDPERRLKGEGKRVRHIALQRIEILDEPAISALIDAAISTSSERLNTGRPGPIIIKSVSQKQRPRRPGSPESKLRKEKSSLRPATKRASV